MDEAHLEGGLGLYWHLKTRVWPQRAHLPRCIPEGIG